MDTERRRIEGEEGASVRPGDPRAQASSPGGEEGRPAHEVGQAHDAGPWLASPLIRAALFALGVDLLLLLLKFTAFALSGSPSIYADAWHTVSDLLISLMVLGSLSVEHRLGKRGRAVLIENLTALLVSLFIIANGIYVALGSRSSGSYVPLRLYLGLGGTLVTILTIYLLARFKLRIAKRYGSLSFEAEGRHSLSDLFTSLAVFVSLLLALVGIDIERVTAVVIGLLILRIGVGLLVKAIAGLKRKQALHPEAFLGQGDRPFWRYVSRFASGVVALFAWCSGLLRRFVWLLLLLVLACYLLTGLHRVGPGQRALHLCFGKLSGPELKPGLHYHPPAPFCSRAIEDVARHRRMTFGFTLEDVGLQEAPPAFLWGDFHGRSRDPAQAAESLHLTGDARVVDLSVVVGYRIRSLRSYLLVAEEPARLLNGQMLSYLSSRVAHESLDSLLTIGREGLEKDLLERARAISRELGLGIESSSVQILQIHPPTAVVPVYRGVASAREARQEKVDRAKGHANDLLPRSRGKARGILDSARTYRATRLAQAIGRSESFLARRSGFLRHRRLSELRLSLEAAGRALGRAEAIYVLPPSIERKRIYLGREPGKLPAGPTVFLSPRDAGDEQEGWVPSSPEPPRSSRGDPYPTDDQYEEDIPDDEPPEPYDEGGL